MTKPKPKPVPVPFADLTDCGLCCCWIAPDGTGYHLYTGYGGSHCSVAQEIGDESGGRGLDDKGYMHVSYGGPFFGHPDQSPTQAQLDYVFDLSQELTKRGRTTVARYITDYLHKQEAEVSE